MEANQSLTRRQVRWAVTGESRTDAGAGAGVGDPEPDRTLSCQYDVMRPAIASVMMPPTCSAASTRRSSAKCA